MKKITIAKKITTVFLLLMMLTAAAGVRVQCSRLKFAMVRTTAVINGWVDKSKHACYDLHARDGQRMTVHLTSPGKRARFYIAPNDYDADFLDGANGVTDWEGELGSASGSGNFRIVVDGQRAGATFTLEVTIR